MNNPFRIFVSGPLAALSKDSCAHLLNWGYTQESAANQLHLMAHLSRWLAGERLDVHTFRADDLQRYFQFRRQAGYTHCVSMKAMLPMLTYLKAEGITFAAASGVSRGPVGFAIDQHRDYLVHERGLAQLTVHNYINAVRPFLMNELSHDGDKIKWELLNAAKVTAFVVRVPRVNRESSFGLPVIVSVLLGSCLVILSSGASPSAC